MPKPKNDEILNAYVQETEGEYKEGAVTQSPFTEAKVEVVDEPNSEPQDRPNAHQTLVDQMDQNRVRGLGAPQNSGLKYRDNVGWLKIPIETLPTKGMFYPDGFEISIRAARGEEIKHWSTMNDHDIQQLSRTDDILNYMIEKCCNVKNPNYPGNSWKDLKNVDRFYILFTIKEFTFLDGENELMVPISEGKDIPVTKDMIDFISVPDEVMKFYNPDKKCFTFNVGGTAFNMHIPSIGVNDWLKKYASQKINAREGYDEDFLTYAHAYQGPSRTVAERLRGDGFRFEIVGCQGMVCRFLCDRQAQHCNRAKDQVYQRGWCRGRDSFDLSGRHPRSFRAFKSLTLSMLILN